MAVAVVKSAGRVLEVLEFFSATRQPASVADVVRGIDIPQSSASMLLRSLVELGYLEYLPESRQFRPTLRVALLGDWIGASLLEGPLRQRLAALQQETGETVLLGRRQGSQLQYVFAVQPQRSVQLFLRPGLTRPMTRTALGRVLLSRLPDATARRIIRRNNAEARAPEHRVDETGLMAGLRDVRRTGFAESDAYAATPDAHIFAALLTEEGDTEPLAVGVGGPAPRVLVRRDDILAALRNWLGAQWQTDKAGAKK